MEDGTTECYTFGVIDFLQKFDTKKKFALFAKSLTHDKEGLSTADPAFYAKRFKQMAKRVVMNAQIPVSPIPVAVPPPSNVTQPVAPLPLPGPKILGFHLPFGAKRQLSSSGEAPQQNPSPQPQEKK